MTKNSGQITSENRDKSSIFLSVAVCTRNRGPLLKDCLLSLYHQSLRKEQYEVLVIDNNSDDGSEVTARKLCRKYQFKYIQEKNVGLSHARNRAVEDCQGDYLYFLDDDATAPVHYLQLLQKIALRDAPDVVGGPVLGNWEDFPPPHLTSFYWRVFSLAHYGNKSRLLQFPDIILGGNAAYKVETLRSMGAFSTSLGRIGSSLGGHEERDLQERIYKAKGKVFYHPRLFIYHIVPIERMSSSYFKKRAFEDGAQQVELGYLRRESLVTTPFTFIYYVFFALGRSFKLAFQVLLFELNLSLSHWKGRISRSAKRDE